MVRLGDEMSDPVAAVTEAEATGEVAAVFADIRAVYGVGVVNLVWRHLATIPGGLEWVWGVVRPSYVAGAVAREADALRAGLKLPGMVPLPACVKQSAGLNAADQAAVGAVLAGYDRTNAMALVALSAVLARLDGAPGGGPVPAGTAPTDAAVALPALPALTAMTPDTAAMVERLNRMGTSEAAPILASMYRHLSYWPGYLALAWTQLAPLEADGVLAEVIAKTQRAVVRPAKRLALGMPESLPADPEAVRAAVARFTGEPGSGGPISRMAVICAVMRAGYAR
jgi:hypothetical protein